MRKSGGMSTIASDIETDLERVPLSGAKLDAAIRAMDAPDFSKKLTARIMKLAADKGFFSPFADDVDLPGGESAAGLVNSIVQKALEGTYTWDMEKHPDFYWFCYSRAESILSNLLTKNRRMTTMSPIEEDDADGETLLNPVNQAVDGQYLYDVLRSRDGGRLGDKLLEDFALSMEDQHDQNILMAVHDDRECISRNYCRGKLGLSERDYDVAMKRIRRAGPAFLHDWCKKNNVKLEDRQEAK
jgi:hypothetical protein